MSSGNWPATDTHSSKVLKRMPINHIECVALLLGHFRKILNHIFVIYFKFTNRFSNISYSYKKQTIFPRMAENFRNEIEKIYIKVGQCLANVNGSY